ncbi:MAG: SpoIID/LytB domain-containing protein [Myxococcota bacterium]
MRARRPSRPCPRAFVAAIVFATWVALVGPLVASTAWAAGSPSVRVLLAESKEPVAIGDGARGQRVTLAREGSGLVVDGAPVGARWSPRGDGPWQVAGRRYRGRLELLAAGPQILVVNHVELEDYVAATVGGEMPASWPEQALRAQAVATRTYALHQRDLRRAEPWDVRATEQSQVYHGLESESAPTRRAADATRGEILTHSGRPILAAFHSTSGGRTASASEVWGKPVPYLDSVEVEHEEDAPFTYWRTVIAPETLDGLLAAMGADLGPLHALEVDGRTESGRVERLIASGRSRRIYIRGDHLRTLVESLGLRSRLFDIRDTPEGFAFVGSGYGHGVGMSQWGARELARRGAPYQRILARFYPGARLETWRGERVASRSGASKQGR